MTARTEQITQDEKRKEKELPQAESSLSSVWAAAVSKYRQTFRNSSIPSSYSEYHHFGLINLVGGSVILLTSYLGGGPVHMLTHGSSLFVIIFGFLFCNYFEWSTHRYRLHDPVKHTRHSHTHHRFFTEKVMVFDSFRDVHAILFPFQAPFFLSVLILVLSIVPMIFFGFQTAMAFACTLACYYVSYEWMHLSYHSPPTSFLGSLPGVAFLRRHHQIHHSQALMGKYNFNITWPICDYLFGTTYKGPVSSDGVPLLDKPTSTPQLDDSNSPVESKPLTANSNGDESKDDVDEIELDEAPPAIGSYTYHALRVYEFFHPSLQLLKDVAPGGLLTLVAFMIGLMVFKTWLTLLIFIVFFMVVILPYLLPKVSLPSYDPLLMLETDEKLFKDTTALVNQADPLSPESPPSTSKVDLVKGSDKALSEGKSPPPTQFQTESKARIEALTEKKFPSSTASASYTHFVSLSQPNRVFASIRQLNLTPLIRIEFDRDAKFPFALTRKSSHLRPDLSHLRGSKHVVVNIVCGPRLMLRVAKYVVGASTLRPVGRFGGHQIIRLLLTEQRYNFIIAEKPPRMILSHIGEGEVGGLYAKHALLCELGEALFAGELWKDKQGEIHFNNASGTYRPKEENLKYVRTYLQEALNLPVHQHDRAEKEKKKEQGNDHSANH